MDIKIYYLPTIYLLCRFSTAVLAAWFKFSQTNEVWPLVHNRENYFTSIQIGLVNENQIIPVKILNNTMP